jgi:hypothetical protein
LNNIRFCHSEPAFFAGEESAVGWQNQIPFGKLRAGSRAMKLRFEMTNFSNCTTTELKTALPFHNGNRVVTSSR